MNRMTNSAGFRSLDRIEGNFGVVIMPDGTPVNIPLGQLPLGIREGDFVDGDKAAYDAQKK